MNITQLESDLRAVREKAATLIQETSRKCEEPVTQADGTKTTGRLMTKEERGAIDALLAEGEGLQKRIDAAKGDAELLEKLGKLGGGTALVPRAQTLPARTETRSLGAQFTQSDQFRQLIESGVHRAGRSWASGVVECYDFRATTLTSDPASGGKLVVPQYTPGIVQTMFKRLVVADLMGSGTADSNAITYMVETFFTNAAAPVLEGGAKPESALVFDQKTDAVSKIAHWLPVTEELLEDVAAIASHIDARACGPACSLPKRINSSTATAPRRTCSASSIGLVSRPPSRATPARRRPRRTPTRSCGNSRRSRRPPSCIPTASS